MKYLLLRFNYNENAGKQGEKFSIKMQTSGIKILKFK